MSNVESKKCNYEGCNLPVYLPHDENYCLGHAPIENKNCTEQEFFHFLNSKKFHTNDYNFDGFKFPFSEIFNHPSLKNFNTPVSLKKCEFHGTKVIGTRTICLFVDSVHFQSLDFSNSIFFHDCVINKCGVNEIRMDEVIFNGEFELNVYTSSSLISRKGTFDGLVNFKFMNGLGSIKLQNSTFNSRLDCRKQIFKEKVDILNCHFNGDVIFENSEFYKNINISGSDFQKSANFYDTTFKDQLIISTCTFEGVFDTNESTFEGIVSILNSKFNGGFYGQSINCIENCYYHSSEFQIAVFNFSTFHKNCEFNKSIFNANSLFQKTRFNGITSFKEVHFTIFNTEETVPRDSILFNQTYFNDVIEFELNHISGDIKFSNVILSDSSFFKIKNIIPIGENRILFEDINFKPFKTVFEDLVINLSEVDKPNVIAFRNCNLKDVLFSNCLMNNFSFYKSTFDSAIFISSKWTHTKEKNMLLPFERKNIIFEDYFFSKLAPPSDEENHNLLKNYYYFFELNSFEEIANLYRRFKVALDNTKDYEQAGWFYFNEYEMKRRACLEDSEQERKWIKIGNKYKRKSVSKYMVYSLYKLFAGYGEKPLWSFYWLMFSAFVFSIVNLFNGIKFNGANLFDYSWDFSSQGFINSINLSWLSDFCTSIGFTFSRIIPLGYLPIPKEQFIATTPTEYIISIANTLVLLFFLTFIAVGLKRIFRRF